MKVQRSNCDRSAIHILFFFNQFVVVVVVCRAGEKDAVSGEAQYFEVFGTSYDRS